MIRPFTALTDATPVAPFATSHPVLQSSTPLLTRAPRARLLPLFGIGAALGLVVSAHAAPIAATPTTILDPAPSAVSAIKTAPAAMRQRTRIRLAQLTQGTSNTPAAAPQENPPRLEVPVGPAQTPPIGQAAPPPADATTPRAPVLGPPQTTSEVPPVIGNVAEAEGREISDVRVVGNRVIPTETILAQVRTQRGAAFSGRQAELDRGRIDQLGFFATVQSQVTPDVEQPNKVAVTFIVQENRVVTSFRFVNASTVKGAEIVPVLTSKIGTVLNRNNVNLDVAAIQKLYSGKGFVVEVQSAQLDENGALVFTLQEGRISRVELSGLKKTRPALLRRQIRVKSGDIFDATKIRRDVNRIFDLGFFEDATFDVKDDPSLPGSVIVTYLLKEKRTGQLSFGVGFDSRSRISGFASIQENNLKGTGQRVGASLETGSRRNYELSFGNPFIGEKNASFDASIYNRTIFREPRLVNLLTGNGGGSPVINPDGTISFNGVNRSNTFSYEEQRTGGRLNLTKPLDYDRNRTLLFGYRNEKATLFQRDSNNGNTPLTGSGTALDDSGRISAFSFGILRDVRDIRLDPSRGSRQQIIVEQGTRLLGDTTFTKLDTDFRFYVPLIPGLKISDQARLVFATRFVGGFALNQLPSFEQYFVGGSDTVRGYQSDEQFGDNQFYGNFELRYRFQPKIQLVGFVDAGSAFGGRFSTSRSVNTLFGFGAGVRLQTPVGPVRLDIGRGDRGVQTHFGIGPSF